MSHLGAVRGDAGLAYNADDLDGTELQALASQVRQRCKRALRIKPNQQRLARITGISAAGARKTTELVLTPPIITRAAGRRPPGRRRRHVEEDAVSRAVQARGKGHLVARVMDLGACTDSTNSAPLQSGIFTCHVPHRPPGAFDQRSVGTLDDAVDRCFVQLP